VASGAQQIRNRLGAHLGTQLRERGVAGMAITLGDTRDVCAVWVPDSLRSEPQFLTYSITKTFTAALALALQEENRLCLDDSLARWFPEVDRSAQITVRMLLNHTAGVPDYGGLRAYHEAVRRSPGEPWTFEEFADHTWRKGLLFEPGTGWAYSNPGYMLVRSILSACADESYSDLVRSRICRVLELERTYVPESVSELARLAPATSTLLASTGESRDVRFLYHPGWVSHGVVASSASEVAIFVHALLTGRLVGERAVRELTVLVPVPDAPPGWRKPSYGLGVMADPDLPLGLVIGHNGEGPGYNSSVFHAPRFRPGGATVCAMCAVEDNSLAESLVRDSFALL
jgi:D-alanyl-D-alanine carboxypeptidase